MMKTKQTSGVKLIKADAEAGTAQVAFAQLEVIDHDGDYTMPGAFTTGEQVKVCQTGHAHGELPAGVGEIVGEIEVEGAKWAVADVRFFMDTIAGSETYKTVKAIHDAGHSQEWSYGYDTLAQAPGQVDGKQVNLLQKQHVYEISPVLRGAGIGTHTLGVKGKAGECDACGQPLPKAAGDADAKADDELEACADCGKDEDACSCSTEKTLGAETAFVTWLATKHRHRDVLAAREQE